MDLSNFSVKGGMRFSERHYPGTGDELDPLLNATAEHRRRVKAIRWCVLLSSTFGAMMLIMIILLIYSEGSLPIPDEPVPAPGVNLTSDVLTDPLIGS